MSSNIAVEYIHIKLCPVKLLNKAIAMQVQVAFLWAGSIRACHMLSSSDFYSDDEVFPAISMSISFSYVC